MKKLLLGILAVITMFSLVACGEKKVDVVDAPEKVETVKEPELIVVDEDTTADEESGEQVGVGNTDEGMVVLALEQHYKNAYPDVVEEVVPTNIKVYSEDEIKSAEELNGYEINDGDIVFSAEYDLKIVDGYENIMEFTAGTGEIDGQWVRNKHNVGIARNNGEDGYSIDAFGTAF